MKKIGLLLAILVTGCDQQPQKQASLPLPSQESAQSAPLPAQSAPSSSPSLGEHIAASAAGGLAAGVGGGIAHAATSHAINRWQENREAKRPVVVEHRSQPVHRSIQAPRRSMRARR